MLRTTAPQAHTRTSLIERFGGFPWPLVFLLLFSLVALGHLTLLHLPYFWDEGGYYVPAALDFYRTGTLIPVFTNAHPPFPSIILGSLWHLFGVHILVTRLTACAFAAAGLTAVYLLGKQLVGVRAACALVGLTSVYPIWYAQSSLAHADIFAAAFTLAALSLYLPSVASLDEAAGKVHIRRLRSWTCVLFCLSVLAKETAVVQPAALAGYELYRAFRSRHSPSRRQHLQWVFALAIPIPVLATWFGYHYLKTGQIFGNPVFLKYNATANFTAAHVLYALRIRFLHLFWQRNLWLPLALALASFLFLPRRPDVPGALSKPVFVAICVLVIGNLLAFSVLGGALLTRYLLPVYPLLLLVCVAVWQEHVPQWPWLVSLTAIAFLSAIWLNPATFFAPEDNLTYRDMIVVQQDAIRFVNHHFPEATVLTAWPVAADLTRPELGYTTRPFRVYSVEGFSSSDLAKAAAEPGRYDTAIVFTTHYLSPAFRNYLLTHPTSWRGRRYAADLDLMPNELARALGGTVVWTEDHDGEWAAVLRFQRTYNARAKLTPEHAAE